MLLSTIRVALGSAAAAAVLLVVATTRADVDLWGHVRFGLDIIDSGQVPTVDSYSFTSDVPWINHEWLAEVIIALAWGTAGGAGLILLKLACVVGVLAFVHLTLKSSGVGGGRQVMLLGLTLVGVLSRVTHVRPQLFSVLLFAALIFLLERASRGARRALLATVPLLVAWANLHGGWIVGLGTLGAWAVCDAWQRRSDDGRAYAVLAYPIAAAAATLINPYGVGLWTFLLETVRFGREAITEWGPAWSDPLVLFLWVMFAAMAVIGARRGPLPRHAAMLVIPAMWGIAAMRVSRLDAFFVISVVGCLGPQLARLLDSASPRRRSPLPLLVRSAAVAIPLVLLMAAPAARRAVTCVELHAPWWPEPELVAFANQHKLSGRLVTFFRWGEYAIWHMPSSVKVSMDGRRETVYSDATVGGHLRLYQGREEGLDYLEALASDYVWLPRMLPVSESLQKMGWIPVFQGPSSVLLARPDLIKGFDAAAPASVDASSERCFPGP